MGFSWMAAVGIARRGRLGFEAGAITQSVFLFHLQATRSMSHRYMLPATSRPCPGETRVDQRAGGQRQRGLFEIPAGLCGVGRSKAACRAGDRLVHPALSLGSYVWGAGHNLES